MRHFVNASAVLLADSPEQQDLWIDDNGFVASPLNSDSTMPGTQTEKIDVYGAVITPGLVNVHNHLLQSAFRTLPGSRGVPMAEWLGVMAAAYSRIGLDPELCFLSARVAAAESVLCGVTTLTDHHLNWPKLGSIDESVEIADAIIRGVHATGARSVYVRGSAGNDPNETQQSAAAIAEHVLQTQPAATTQVAVGPAGVHSDAEATFRGLTEVATQFGLVRRTQANEEVDVVRSLELFGERPITMLKRWGWLNSDVTIAHLCEVTDSEIDMLAEAGVHATHAPGCDVPMGWGITPVHKLLAHGITVGLGTSGAGSNDGANLLADARLALQVSGLSHEPLDALTCITMATEGSALTLGRTDIGNLRAGARADLAIWPMDDVADAGVHDRVASLLWTNVGRRPSDVYVQGEQVVRNRELLTTPAKAAGAELDELLATR